MPRRATSSGVRSVLEGDEVHRILRETFFAPGAAPEDAAPGPEATQEIPLVTVDSRASGVQRAAKRRPDHYKVICISLYTQDLERLDGVVRELKRRGYTKANRSAVLRVALEQLDLDKVPKGM